MQDEAGRQREEAGRQREEQMLREMKMHDDAGHQREEQMLREMKMLHAELLVVTLACIGISFVALLTNKASLKPTKAKVSEIEDRLKTATIAHQVTFKFACHHMPLSIVQYHQCTNAQWTTPMTRDQVNEMNCFPDTDLDKDAMIQFNSDLGSGMLERWRERNPK
eukprot:15335046-Ditylum_brightwellii.AAC.1